MGPAADFTSSLTPGLTPGVSIKFLRSGTSSANFVLLKELNPLPDNSHNFFGATLTNHLPANIDITDAPTTGKVIYDADFILSSL